MIITKEDLERLQVENCISRHGYGYDEKVDSISLEEFSKCVKWIEENLEVSNKTTCNSYQIKHLVEQDMGGYIPNGAAILAALFLKIKTTQDDGKNAKFGAKIKTQIKIGF